MLAAKVFVCALVIVLIAGSLAQADDKTACPVEEVHLSMLKKQRDGEERKIAELAVMIEQERTRRTALEQQVKLLMERIAKAEGEKKPD